MSSESGRGAGAMFGGSAHNRVSVTPQGSCLRLTSVRRVGDTRPSRTPGNRGDGPWLAGLRGLASPPALLLSEPQPHPHPSPELSEHLHCGGSVLWCGEGQWPPPAPQPLMSPPRPQCTPQCPRRKVNSLSETLKNHSRM